MPTTCPRYTVTDTGKTAELDLAQQMWPEITDRRQQLVGLQRASQLVHVEELLSGGAWH